MTREQATLAYLEKYEGEGITFVCKVLDSDYDRVFYIDRGLFELFGYGEYLHMNCDIHTDPEYGCVKRIKKVISLWEYATGIDIIEKEGCGMLNNFKYIGPEEGQNVNNR